MVRAISSAIENRAFLNNSKAIGSWMAVMTLSPSTAGASHWHHPFAGAHPTLSGHKSPLLLPSTASRPIPALQLFRWHTPEVQGDEDSIPHGGIEHTVLLPAAPGRGHRLRENREASVFAQGLHQADIFHEGDIVVATQDLEDMPGHEECLIAIGQLSKAGPQIRTPGDQAESRRRRHDGEAKCSPY